MVLLLSVAMLGTQSIMAAEDAPAVTLTDVIMLAGETIEAMKNNEGEDKIAALLKATKQASKSVVISGPADLNKQRASMRIKKSRKAFRKGEMEKAIELAEEGLDYYKKAKAIHF